MNIQEQKVELARMILSTDDEQVLKRLRAVFQEEGTDFWDGMSVLQQKIVEESIAQADRGELVTHAKAMSKYRKWL